LKRTASILFFFCLIIWNQSLSAQTQVYAASYSYPTSPSASYPDSGGELTDGTKSVTVWPGSANVGPLVGWVNVNPSITFTFSSTVEITEIRVWAADSDNSAGVGLPSAATITVDGVSKTISISNPSGSGTTVSSSLANFYLKGNSITIELTAAYSWTMLSEVEFFGPSSGALGITTTTDFFAGPSNTSTAVNMSGIGSINKIGSGILTLSGSNTYSGGTTISSGKGTIKSASNTAFGTGNINVNGINGGTGGVLDLNGSTLQNKVILEFNNTGLSGNGCLINSNISTPATIDGLFEFGGNNYVGGDGDITFNGVASSTGTISTSYNLFKQGTGTWKFSNEANTFDGFFYIIGGTVEVNKLASLNQTSSLGKPTTSTANRVSFGYSSNGGGSLSFVGSNSCTSDRAFILHGSTSTTSKILSNGQNSSATLTLSGNLSSAVSGSFNFALGGSSSAVNSFDGAISNGTGTISLIKEGSTTWKLTGSNSYTGSTTISAGVLNIQNATGTGTTAGGVSVTSGAALELQGGITVGAEALTINSTGVSSGGSLRNISGNNTWGGTVTQASASRINSDAGTLTLSASNAITGTYNLTIGGAGNTTVSGTITTSTGTLTKDGAGTLTLSGANTYSGLTTVSAGTLQLNKTGGTTIPSTNNVSVSGGTLKVSSNQELNNLTVSSGSLVVDAGVTLTISGTFTGGGTIANNGTIIAKGSSSFPGSTTTISAMNNLTIDRSAGVTLDKDITVTGTLTLTTGILDVGTTTLTVSGSIAGTTSSKYIKTSSTGGLKQSVSNSAVSFPVGNSGYNPISITNNTGSADNFTIKVIDEVYANGTSSGSTISTLRVKRIWDIAKETPSANAGTGVDMVFNWTPASHTSGTLVIPKLYHYESSAWVKKSIISNTTYDVVAGTLTFSGYRGDFSPFAIIDDGTTLPVTWQSFTAEKQGATSLLKWSTASEQNTKDFEVQHSTNTISWTPLGIVAAAGNSTTTRQYSFVHNTPFKGGVYNFYRIMQRDIDGRYSYSKIASLIYNEPGADFIVYPNPAKESVTIYISESKEVKLVNVAGATVWKGILQAGRNQVNLQPYAKGIYWVVAGSVKKQIIIQ
jgi:autotransporter-associated beta strand protein